MSWISTSPITKWCERIDQFIDKHDKLERELLNEIKFLKKSNVQLRIRSAKLTALEKKLKCEKNKESKIPLPDDIPEYEDSTFRDATEKMGCGKAPDYDNSSPFREATL